MNKRILIAAVLLGLAVMACGFSATPPTATATFGSLPNTGPQVAQATMPPQHLSPEQQMMSTPISLSPKFDPGTPVVLFQTRILGPGQQRPPGDVAGRDTTGTVRPNTVAPLPPEEQPEDGKVEMPAQFKRQIVNFQSNEPAGTIVPYLAEVPELPGCMADGKTHVELLANLEQVVDLWISAARRQGRPVPEPKGRLRYA